MKEEDVLRLIFQWCVAFILAVNLWLLYLAAKVKGWIWFLQ